MPGLVCRTSSIPDQAPPSHCLTRRPVLQQPAEARQAPSRSTPPAPRGPPGGYRETDSPEDSGEAEDREFERQAAEQKAAQAAVPALLPSLEGLDDEVERILGHR